MKPLITFCITSDSWPEGPVSCDACVIGPPLAHSRQHLKKNWWASSAHKWLECAMGRTLTKYKNLWLHMKIQFSFAGRRWNMSYYIQLPAYIGCSKVVTHFRTATTAINENVGSRWGVSKRVNLFDFKRAFLWKQWT